MSRPARPIRKTVLLSPMQSKSANNDNPQHHQQRNNDNPQTMTIRISATPPAAYNVDVVPPFGHLLLQRQRIVRIIEEERPFHQNVPMLYSQFSSPSSPHQGVVLVLTTALHLRQHWHLPAADWICHVLVCHLPCVFPCSCSPRGRLLLVCLCHPWPRHLWPCLWKCRRLAPGLGP